MKIKVGIIGTGNIGTDLLIKCFKKDFIDPVIFVGRRESSEGIKKAFSYNAPISFKGLDHFKANPHCCDVVFDCTNAVAAVENYEVFKSQGIKVIDMTPAKLGVMCIPVINPEAVVYHDNVNMITCGGQASIPLLDQMAKLSKRPIEYIELVSQISSKSAGIATRWNIDQYIGTTEKAIKHFTGCKECKVILNLNPAEPEVHMQNTMFIKMEELPFDSILESLMAKIKEIKTYVPSYDMTMIPVINDDGVIIFSIKAEGAGDYLPPYAGNLDIINCAAIKVLERL
jgi:acetaldehyde dehydrogenase (acetylating)